MGELEMDIDTMISKDIRCAKELVRYDAACKKLLSEKIILAWIMKYCLDEYKDCDVKEIAEKYIENEPQVGQIPVAPDETVLPKIHQMATQDKTINEGEVNYDIRFMATAPSSNELIKLIINVEAQNNFRPGYPLIKRGIYYASRLISSQYGMEFTEPDYGKIKKVYSIWLCMNPPKLRNNSITKYRITEENLVGEVREKFKDYDLMTVIMVCLGDIQDKSSNELLGMLNVLFSKEIMDAKKIQILQDDFDMAMTKRIKGEVSDMCNLSVGVFEKGMEKGILKGCEETRINDIIALMESLGLTEDQAMNALKIPKEKQSEYSELLKNE